MDSLAGFADVDVDVDADAFAFVFVLDVVDVVLVVVPVFDFDAVPVFDGADGDGEGVDGAVCADATGANSSAARSVNVFMLPGRVCKGGTATECEFGAVTRGLGDSTRGSLARRA